MDDLNLLFVFTVCLVCLLLCVICFVERLVVAWLWLCCLYLCVFSTLLCLVDLIGLCGWWLRRWWVVLILGVCYTLVDWLLVDL